MHVCAYVSQRDVPVEGCGQQEGLSSFHLLCWSGNHTQVVRVDDECLSLLSHLAGPCLACCNHRLCIHGLKQPCTKDIPERHSSVLSRWILFCLISVPSTILNCDHLLSICTIAGIRNTLELIEVRKKLLCIGYIQMIGHFIYVRNLNIYMFRYPRWVLRPRPQEQLLFVTYGQSDMGLVAGLENSPSLDPQILAI